jgi:hypothetical protein
MRGSQCRKFGTTRANPRKARAPLIGADRRCRFPDRHRSSGAMLQNRGTPRRSSYRLAATRPHAGPHQGASSLSRPHAHEIGSAVNRPPRCPSRSRSVVADPGRPAMLPGAQRPDLAQVLFQHQSYWPSSSVIFFRADRAHSGCNHGLISSGCAGRLLQRTGRT